MSQYPKSGILAITSHDDAHLAVVQQFLTSEILVIDPLAVLVDADLSFGIAGGNSQVVYRGRNLSGIKSVWFRKPTHHKDIRPKVEENLKDYSDDAVKQHCALIYDQFPSAGWISPYYNIRRAHNKSLGLRTASSLGLRVPDTLFTSDQRQAEAFMADYPQVIIKSLSRTFPRTEDLGPTMFFARKANRGDPLDLSGLHLAPAVFQQAVDADYDLRVVVVGGQVFTSKVTNEGLPEQAVRDWRLGHFTGTVRFEPYDSLPHDIAEKCVQLTRKLGLKFGAIDLVQDKRGSLWFLEINANGQWAFVDDQTANAIGKAIANLLQNPEPPL